MLPCGKESDACALLAPAITVALPLTTLDTAPLSIGHTASCKALVPDCLQAANAVCGAESTEWGVSDTVGMVLPHSATVRVPTQACGDLTGSKGVRLGAEL